MAAVRILSEQRVQEERLAWQSDCCRGRDIPRVWSQRSPLFVESGRVFRVPCALLDDLRPSKNAKFLLEKNFLSFEQSCLSSRTQSCHVDSWHETPRDRTRDVMCFATSRFGVTFSTSSHVKVAWWFWLAPQSEIHYCFIKFQLYSTYILQGLHLEASYNGFTIPTAWLSLFEIVTLLLMVPLIERGAYPALSKSGIEVPVLWRIFLGMLLAAGSAGMGMWQD